jgi:hypothetical protein
MFFDQIITFLHFVMSDNSTLGAKVGMLWLDIEGTQVRDRKQFSFLVFNM